MIFLRALILLFFAILIAANSDQGDKTSDDITQSKQEQPIKAEKAEQNSQEKEEELNEFDREHRDAGILSLSDKDFDEVVASHEAVLVKFYTPWCIHSRALAPEYVKAARILQAKNSTVRLARIDASLEKKTAEKYDVKGYPTLKFIKGDSVIDFNGGKTGQAIAAWAEAKLKPATTNITTVKEADEFVLEQSVTILGLFQKETAENMSKILEETAFTKLNEIPCGVTDNEELMAHFGVQQDTIILFQNIDKERFTYEGPFDTKSIADFVKKNKLPLVVEFTHSSAPDIFGGEASKHLLLFVRKSQEEDFKASVSQMREPAKAFKNRVIFIFVDMDNGEHEKILQFFGVKESDPPSLRLIALDQNMAKYRPTFETITSEAITEFVQGVLDNKIDPHLPSQELPDDWDKNPVKVLVTKNFDNVTMDQNKTVFVMFYAPWCDHSKALAPVWEQLAQEYASNETIVIARMDSSENELPDMKIMSFPTLKLFPANSNDVIDYYGMDRSLQSLKIFLDSGGKKQPGVNDHKEPKPDDANPDAKTKEGQAEKSGPEDEEGNVKPEDSEEAEGSSKEEL